MEKPQTKPLSIRVDWKAYFRAFCQEHGHPIEIGGRLLFPDGWMYSATDYKGPEWPPEDSDRAKALRRVYWKRRRRSIRQELMELKTTLQDLETMNQVKSAPLYVVNTVGYNLLGMEVIDRDNPSIEFNAEEYALRVADLERMLEECEGHLTKETSDV